MSAALVAGVVLAIAAPASATIPSGNLVTNGNAETGTAGDGTTVTPPASWTPSPNFTQIAYGSSGFPTLAEATAWGGGNGAFIGGPDGAVNTADQVIAVSGAAPEIDAHRVTANLSADLGGFSSQEDNAMVDATFQGPSGALGTVTVGPVTATERSSSTTLLLRSASAPVPAGTRSIAVRITATRNAGTYNDGSADNVVLTLTGTNLPPGQTTGAGGDKTLADLPAPVLGKKTNVEPVKGKVRVSIKGGKFISLSEARQIPVGAVLDTRKGTVRLQSASGARKPYQGDFDGGLFKITQSNKKKDKGLTQLALQGGSFNSCKTKKPKGKKATAALSKKALRRLHGSAKGKFRTRGRYSAATIRGTKWEVADRCDGTLTRVIHGNVEVRDFLKRKTVFVKTGKTYLARAGRLP